MSLYLDSLPTHPFNLAKTWLVIGSAGAGKSSLLERTIDELIVDGVSPREIMFIQFNKEPADSFKQRYYDKGYTKEDLQWLGTHHSIMKKLKKIPSKNILEGEKFIKWGEDNGFEFTGNNETYWDNVFFSLSRKLYQKDKDYTLQERQLLDALHGSEIKDNLWTHVRYLVSGCEMGLFPSGVNYVLVDEAQDNSVVQMDWLKGLSVEGLMLAGDDKQAINEFKGSDPYMFLDFPVDKRVSLPISFRCPSEVLKYANGIISPLGRRSPLATVAMKQGGTVMRDMAFDDMAAYISMRARAGKSVLALVRNNYLVNTVMYRLSSYPLPVSDAAYRTFKSVIRTLIEVRNSKTIDMIQLKEILPSAKKTPGQLTPGAYWSKEALEALRKGNLENEIWQRLSFGETISIFDLFDIGFRAQFAIDLAQWDIDLDKWNLSHFDLKRFKAALACAGEFRLMTIHAAKGLEADIVVLFKDTAGRCSREELMYPDNERRVWYVGATRSKSELITTTLNYENKITSFV